MVRPIRFIDLFAGIGGIRKGFELACEEMGYQHECVFTSEIKPHAIDVLKQNHPDEEIAGDITQIASGDIPDFDFLLGGFPCQAFSSAGKRLGFSDTRGTLFFEVERILKEKDPFGFVLENVEGLVNHDKTDKNEEMGRTLATIIKHLEDAGYEVNWRVLNAKYFGVPQERKRIYIIGTKTQKPDMDGFPTAYSTLADILECGKPTENSRFINLLLSHYELKNLEGMAIKDKRGGDNNIHSWDIELKGSVTQEQKKLLSAMLKERRKKRWAIEYGIDWMDGMPLTLQQIKTFYDAPQLESMLEELVDKGYVKREHPKRKVNGARVQDASLPIGYNIVAGKMSFQISKVLASKDIAPTFVAMDMVHLYVVDGDGLRNLTLREGLRAFGYPEDFKFDIDKASGYDLLGNTVAVPVIKQVSKRVLSIYAGGKKMVKKVTPEEIYRMLLEDDQIKTKKGQIRFQLDDIDIVVRQKDVVGNIIQEWLEEWLKKKEIAYKVNDNTQMPPDFFLDPDDKKKQLLEIKAFNYKQTPAFDIADFRMYQHEIIEKPYMLDVFYLIFGYEMTNDGVVLIRDVWLKKVWEITRRMENWPLNLQIKEKRIHKIRPGLFFTKPNGKKTSKTSYPMFRSMEDFISAIEETVYRNSETRNEAGKWLSRFKASYEKAYGIKLTIPRWNELEERYKQV